MGLCGSVYEQLSLEQNTVCHSAKADFGAPACLGILLCALKVLELRVVQCGVSGIVEYGMARYVQSVYCARLGRSSVRTEVLWAKQVTLALRAEWTGLAALIQSVAQVRLSAKGYA